MPSRDFFLDSEAKEKHQASMHDPTKEPLAGGTFVLGDAVI